MRLSCFRENYTSMKSYCKATIYGPTPGPKHSKLEEFSKNELHLIRHVPVSNFHAAVN